MFKDMAVWVLTGGGIDAKMITGLLAKRGSCVSDAPAEVVFEWVKGSAKRNLL